MKKGAVIFIVLSVVASALSYATYPTLARILPSAQYVNITVALSLLTQITTFLSSIVALTIGISKSERHNNTNEKVQLLQAALFKLFLVLGILFLICSPIIMSKAHTPVAFAFPIVLMMLFSIPITILSGYLNGKGLMAKLGVLTVISAALQFVIGVITAKLTHNGVIAMLCMTLAQVATILIVYKLFSSEHLPHLLSAFKTPVQSYQRQYLHKLIAYALLASLAVMVVNLLQIADLLIVQTLAGADLKFYTDIYVISRAVFFAGMIFIWPFLGEIHIEDHRLNRKPLAKLLAWFTFIALGAIGVLYCFGSSIAHLLFGAQYSLHSVREIGLLSILYKLAFLIITAVVLYFVVMRSYVAIWISAILGVAIFAYAELVDKHSSIHTVLFTLMVIASCFAALSLGLVVFRRPTTSIEKRAADSLK